MPCSRKSRKVLGLPDDARNILTPQQVSVLPPGCGLGFAAGRDMAPAMAVVMAGAWAIAPVSEAVMAVDAAWDAEQVSGEPGNTPGEGDPLPRKGV